MAELDGVVGGTLHLTILPGLSRRGASRGRVEAVRVDSTVRSAGPGDQLLTWAIETARKSGCTLAQLIGIYTRSPRMQTGTGAITPPRLRLKAQARLTSRPDRRLATLPRSS